MIPCTNMKVPIGNGWIIGVKPHGIRSNYRNNANQDRSLNDINNYTELSVNWICFYSNFSFGFTSEKW